MVVAHANTDAAVELFERLPYVDHLRFRGKSLRINTAPGAALPVCGCTAAGDQWATTGRERMDTDHFTRGSKASFSSDVRPLCDGPGRHSPNCPVARGSAWFKDTQP